ncbi:S8 family serine peptidase [Lewinella sp. LCG006]|uniref:S8 family serine peptidase n=1 Tax=Lewinella sp. LCG006 TaxID=3231911 RepID=UPI00346152F6
MREFTIINLNEQEISDNLIDEGVALKSLNYYLIPSDCTGEIERIVEHFELGVEDVFSSASRLYVNLCIALDFYIQQGVTVINLSLIIRSRDPYRLVEKLVEIALESKICVVCAIGNKGRKQNSINSLSRIQGVISVGAVDDELRLLDKSSVAPLGEMGPTCVANGNTNLSEKLIDTSPLYKRPKPATSYAAPKVSRSICSIFLMINVIGALIRYSVKKSSNIEKIILTRIGLPDDSRDLNIEQYPDVIKNMYKNNDFSFAIIPEADEIRWIEKLKYGLGQIGYTNVYLSNRPDEIVFVIKEIAQKLTGYEKNEVGYGYISIEAVIEYFVKFTFIKFLKLTLKNKFEVLFHGPHRQFIMQHDLEMRYLWREEKARNYCLLAYNSIMYPFKITY